MPSTFYLAPKPSKKRSINRNKLFEYGNVQLIPDLCILYQPCGLSHVHLFKQGVERLDTDFYLNMVFQSNQYDK